jgi:catalase
LEEGEQLRIRPESFADHYSQARLFYLSQTKPEQNHIVFALVFELSKCVVPRVREAVLSRLIHIDEGLAMRVAAALGVAEIQPAELPVKPQDMKPSPALSILAKALPTLRGRKVGCLVSDGTDDALLAGLRKAVEAAGATFEIIAPRIGGITTAGGKLVPADHKVEGGPSVLFDAVVIIPSREGGAKLSTQAEAVNFLRDAFGHLKVIAYIATAAPLLVKAGMPEANPDNDAGMISLEASSPEDFVKAAAAGRIWDREPYVRDVP